MSAESALARGRRAAVARRMPSRANILRRGDEAETQDEETGRRDRSWPPIYIDTPARIAGSSGSDGGSRGVTVGGVTYEQATAVAHLPIERTDLADGDVIEVTGGEWPGTYWRIVEAVRLDDLIDRRVPVEQISANKESWS